MNEFKKCQTILKIVLVIAIAGGIALGIATEDGEMERADRPYEKIFKLSAFFMVMLALIFYWVLPNTRLGQYFKMNESLFVVTNILGIIFGLGGLMTVFFWREMMREAYIFECIIILFGLIYVYWAMIMKSKKTVKASDILDEKQIDDMTRAASSTLAISTGLLLILYLHNALLMDGRTWFLFYFFTVLLVYSTSTLYHFKKT